MDWSGQNILSVGLGTCVYLWSACTSQVLQLVMLVTNVVSNDIITMTLAVEGFEETLN